MTVHIVDTGVWTPLNALTVRGPLRSADLDGDGLDDMVAIATDVAGLVVYWSVP